MEKKEVRHVTVRLSYDNPEHMKIMGILDDLNLSVHRSKNQFIINAIGYYVDMLENGDLTNAAAKKSEETRYITEQTFEEELSKMKSAVRTEIYEDIIRFLGSGMVISKMGFSETDRFQKNDRSEAEKAEENVPDTLSRFDNVMQHVMDWSDDE